MIEMFRAGELRVLILNSDLHTLAFIESDVGGEDTLAPFENNSSTHLFKHLHKSLQERSLSV